MGLEHMEHFLVLTDDVEKTKDFYCNALGLRVGFRPELDFDGCWIYLGDTAVIHVAETRSYEKWTASRGMRMSSGPQGTGALDHIAFNARDFHAMKRHLEALGHELTYNILDEIGLRQIFVADPSGLHIELNFRE
jgi:catechol 2,3-dioxygenase-like lactoylglutathione lyase family enzyme